MTTQFTLTPAKPTGFRGGYDLESDLGLIAENEDAAEGNSDKLEDALAATWSGGSFTFVGGRQGPVLYPLIGSGKEFYFADRKISTNLRVPCGAIYGSLARSFPWTKERYASDDPDNYGGAPTRFTRLAEEDPEDASGETFFEINGHGFTMEGITLQGRPYFGDLAGAGPDAVLTTTKPPSLISVMSRPFPPTGGLNLRNCTLSDAEIGIHCPGGYYNDLGVFVNDQTHADNSVVDNCTISSCPTAFKSDCIQTINWTFRDLRAVATPLTVFDLNRGGNLHCYGLDLLSLYTILLRVADFDDVFGFTPWVTEFDLQNVKWDRFNADPLPYLTLFKYDGVTVPSMPWVEYLVRITGQIPHAEPNTIFNATSERTFDYEKLIEITYGSTDFPLNEILVGMRGLPKTDFTNAGGGFWTPKNSWLFDRAVYLKFDEGSGTTATDSSGNDLDGTINGSTTYAADRNGVAGQALAFTNNSGSFVNVPDDDLLDVKTLSGISFWIKLNSFVNGVVLSKFGTTGNIQRGFRTEQVGNFLLTENASNILDLTPWITLGQWHNIVMSIGDDDTVSLFIDGVARGSHPTIATSWFNNTNPLRIGAPISSFFDSSDKAADMVIDDVVIYRNPLGLAMAEELFDS